MLLVFILLLLIVIILTTKIKLCVVVENKTNEYLVKVYILYIIPIICINLKKLKSRIKIKEKLNLTKLKKAVMVIRKSRAFKIENFYLTAVIAIGDVVYTSYLTGIISSIIAITVSYANFRINKSRFYYKIEPDFTSKKIFKFEFNCIITASLVHIISILIRILYEWRREQDGRKSSYRKINAYGNE